MKKSKGITLIALIVVMLILVGVTLATVSNSGLFKQAKNARNGYDSAQKAENADAIGTQVNTLLNN